MKLYLYFTIINFFLLSTEHSLNFLFKDAVASFLQTNKYPLAPFASIVLNILFVFTRSGPIAFFKRLAFNNPFLTMFTNCIFKEKFN